MPDLQTLLSYFLNDLYAGTLGVSQPISKILVGDGTAGAPSLSFASETNTGLYRQGTNTVSFTSAGVDYAFLGAGELRLRNNALLQWGSSGMASADVALSRGAADVLMLASGDKLAFGGVTTSQSMLKGNGSRLDVRLADDSAFGPVALQHMGIQDGMTAPSATVGLAKIYVDTADGDLKVIFGDGVVKVLASDV